MRESLTVFAILLIVVLTTALVGPYFVDWNAQRGAIESRLSHLLGARVAIAGPIDVKLLPRPIFRLQDVTVTGATPGDGRVSAERLDLELALAGLLRGEIAFVDADLTRPALTLSVADDGAVRLPRFGTESTKVSLSRVTVHDGSLALVGPDAAPRWRATGISGDGNADTLAGPFKFAGHLDTPRGDLGLRLATGALEGGRMRVKVNLDALAGLPRTEVDGLLSLGDGLAGATLSYDGTLAATGRVPLDEATAMPYRVAAKLHADATGVEASDVELRAGVNERAVVATGSGRLGLGGARAASLKLRARQLDIGRLAVKADASDPAVPSVADAVAALQGFAANADALAGLPVPVSVDFGVDTVSLGAASFGPLEGALTLAPGLPVTGIVAVEAPDGSRLALDGSFEPGPAAVFKGRADAASRDLQRFADGLAADLPEAAAWLRRMLPVTRFGFGGMIDVSGIGFAAHEATLSLDRSTLAGTVTLTRAVGQDRARLFADLTSEALDLGAVTDWRAAAAATGDLDVSFALAARAIRLARSDTGDVSAGRITLQITKSGPSIRLDRLAITDLGGATADLSGRSDGRTAHLEGRLDAAKVRELLGLAQRMAPDIVGDALLARADLLSPALLAVAADATVNADGAFQPTALSVDGTAAGTAVALHLKPEGVAAPPGDPLARFRPERLPFSVALTIDAPETGALLRQLGVATTASTAIGRGRIDATARLSQAGVLDGTATATFADTVLAFKGRGSRAGTIAGKLTLNGPNVAPLLRAVTLAAPEAGAVWPADASAEVAWSEAGIAVKALAGQVIGAHFGGDIAIAPPAATTVEALTAAPSAAAALPMLTGTLTLERLPLPVLAGLALGPPRPPKPGAVWSNAPFGPLPLRLPTSALALRVAALPLTDTAVARNATLTLRLGPGFVTLADLGGALGEGRIGGTLTLRRDGPAASLAGHLDWSGLSLATPALGGRSRGTLDLAGSGASPLALVASLAGGGTLAVDDARLPRFEAGAIARTIGIADAAPSTIDDSEIAQDLAQALDAGALSLGAIAAPASVAAGVLRAEPVRVEGGAIRTEATAALDLRTLAISLKTVATLKTPPKDWSGNPPQVSVQWRGPVAAPTREIDAAALVNGLASRAIGREQARIEAFQDDIRERAFFNRRLKAIEAEQQAARDAARAAQEAERLKLQPPVRPPNAGGKTSDAGKDPIGRLIDGSRAGPIPLQPASPAPTRAPVRPGTPPRPAADPAATRTGLY